MTSEHATPAASDWTPADGIDALLQQTPRERAAERLLALRALEPLLKETAARTRAVDGAAFDRAGQREPAYLPDGTLLGDVRADKGTPAGWKITDPKSFLAWVTETCPDAIVEKVVTTHDVEPDYAAYILDGLTKEGTHVNQATGQEVDGPPPGVRYVPAGPPKLVVTGDKAAPAAVARRLGEALQQLLGLEP